MQLVKYLFTVFVASFFITGMCTWLINKGLVKSGVDFYGKINAAGDSTSQVNLLLVGSSRVLVQLDPQIIDAVTGLRSYNYGFNASTIKTCFNTIQYALHYQKTAKAIVLNIDFNMFSIDQDPYKDAYYYPFENNVPGILMSNTGNSSLIHKARFLDISLYDDFVKFAAIDGWLRPGRTVQGLYKGYYPHKDLSNYEVLQTDSTYKGIAPFSEPGIKILNDIINLCKQKKVHLILILAPYFKKDAPAKYYTNFNTIIDRVKTVAQQSNTPFYDYSSMAIANDKQFFYNVNHLNIKGAAVYSAAVADSVKNYLYTNPSIKIEH